MPPLPVIVDTFRITINWNEVLGVKPVNVFHVSTTGTDVTAIGTHIMADFENACFAAMPNVFQFHSVTVLPLDGISPETTVTATTAIEGEATGAPSPASAGIVSFRTAGRGPAHRGRMFVGPCGEDVIDGGILSDSVRATMLDGWNNFNIALGLETTPIGLVVASYKHAEPATVTNIIIQPVLGTMARRQNQLR